MEIRVFPSTRANTLRGAMILGSGPMPGRRSERMVNITATLPILLLERIDELVAEGKASSRSHAIREAVRHYLET